MRCRKSALALPLLLGLCAPVTVHAQQILQNFTGTSLSNLPALNGGFYSYPPDTQGAVGANSLVEMVNGAYSVYGKSSGAPTQTSSLNQFWQNAGVSPVNGTFDPRVVYDPGAQRYYASALDFGPTDTAGNNNTNDILLAVSKTSDPTQGWTGVLIPGTTTNDHFFVDYDMLGYNGDGVYVSVNNFGSSASADGPATGNTIPDAPGTPGESMLVVSKANLAAGNSGGQTLPTFYNQSFNNTGFAAQPVVDRDSVNGVSGTEYFLSAYNSTTDKVSTVTGPATSPTLTTSGGLVTVTARNDPPAAHQPSGPNTIDSGDTRFDGNVIKVNGELWGVQDITVAGRAGLNIVRINAATKALISETQIADPNHDYYYGSVAVNGQGTIVVGYTRSGDAAGEFASSYASVGTYGAASVTFGSPLLLKAGVADYNLTDSGGRNRWGDYSATMVDPTDPTKFWTIQEWANTPTSYASNWSTQITEISAAPEPSTLASLVLGALGIFGKIAVSRRRRSRLA